MQIDLLKQMVKSANIEKSMFKHDRSGKRKPGKKILEAISNENPDFDKLNHPKEDEFSRDITQITRKGDLQSRNSGKR